MKEIYKHTSCIKSLPSTAILPKQLASDGAVGNFQCRAIQLNWVLVGQGPAVLAAGGLISYVCSGLTSLSTIFQSYDNGVWLQHEAQCSFL